MTSKSISRAAGLFQANLEIGFIDEEYDPVIVDFSEQMITDFNLVRTYANNYAALWLKKAIESRNNGDSFSEAVRTANKASEHRLETLSVTESSAAYNEGKRLAGVEYDGSIELVRVWDTSLENGICGDCESSDGEIVGISEKFSIGEPGTIHPNCRCTFFVSQYDE